MQIPFIEIKALVFFIDFHREILLHDLIFANLHVCMFIVNKLIKFVQEKLELIKIYALIIILNFYMAFFCFIYS